MLYTHSSIQMNQWENSIFNQWKSSLKKCHIEGIEATNSNFDSIVESIKRKPYDILDHRKVLRNSYDVTYVTIYEPSFWNFDLGGRSSDSPQNRGHIRESDDLKRSNYFSTSWYDHNLTQRKFRDHILTDAITLWLPNFSFLSKQNFFMVFNKILFG